jgi:hypothetical protein
MDLLKLLSIGLVTACYSPDLSECTVACSNASDCASEQVCGDDGYCALPGTACQALLDGVDAMTADAPPRDAAMPDAPPTTNVTVRVRGEKQIGGKVVVPGVGMCETPDDKPKTCLFVVTAGSIELEAIPEAGGRFEKWESMLCAGQGSICSETISSPTATISARFKEQPEDDD